MKKILVIAALSISCGTNQDASKRAKEEIITADTAMSNMAVKIGFAKALLLCADDSVIKPMEDKLPIIGKLALEKFWANDNGTKNITWKPTRVEASSSGDFGFTFGNWKFLSKDTVMYGNYCTIWKKQKDGKWKFVYDGGNNTPKPVE